MEYRADNIGALEQPVVMDDGTLVVDARVTRAGVFKYRHYNPDTKQIETVRELRPRDEVAKATSIDTIRLKSVMLGHPTDSKGNYVVPSPETIKDLHAGEVLESVRWEPETDHIRARLTVRRADAIEAVQSKGWRQLSALYLSRIEKTPGVDPEFGPYDAIQRDIRYNGVSIVPRGRAGGTACLRADHAIQIEEQEEQPAPAEKENVMGVVIGGRSFDCSEELASAVEGLSSRLAEQESRADAAERRADSAEAERDTLNAQRADAPSFDAAVYAELREVEKVSEQHGIRADEHAYDAAALKRAVVRKALGEKLRADASDAYIDASFDMLREGLIGGRNAEQRTQAANAVHGASRRADSSTSISLSDAARSFGEKLSGGAS